MHRVGIIPFDTRGQDMALLFVTSQTRGRWILPKGRQRKGESHLDTCHREGFEEAGIRGVVLEHFPITLLVTKQTKTGMSEVPVTYYPFLVTEQVDEWPESVKRQRHWALLEDAPRVAYREDFSVLLKLVDSLKPWIIESAEAYKESRQEALTPAR